MTIARAEMSTNLQNPDSQGAVSKGMSVALIGPNDAHRQVVAKALASAQGRSVHEFIDYPASLNDLARMMETKFDVVLVDVDTDESYALQIIAKLADLGPAVMAYSARTDQELLMSCMRAGACDFLPLPSEDGTVSEPASPPPTPTVQQVVPKSVSSSKPAAAPATPTPSARSNVTSIIPDRHNEAAPEERPAVTKLNEASPVGIPAEAPKQENGTSDFSEWDKANLRPAPPIPIAKKSESRPRPSLVPDRRKTEIAPRVTPEVEETAPPPPPPPIERPPVSVELFRSTTFEQEFEPDEAAEKQGAKWIKLILIGAGPVVLGLILLIVFTHPSSPSPAIASAAAKEEAVTKTPPQPKAIPGSQLIVDATGKSVPTPSGSAKPSPAGEASGDQPRQDPTPVSPDAMAAQLVAPTRIAGTIKKAAGADEPPPAAPATVAFDDSGTLQSSVFGANSKVKVAPRFVPISAGVADGMILRKTPPSYPRFAQEAHITGKVVLKATITKQGNIEGIQVLSGPKILAPAAADAVKTWKYRPYMLDNQPVAVETTITVVFGENGK